MDENLKDVLLVCLGSVSSLLGSALTIFFQQRRDRQIAWRERQTKQNEDLLRYLFSVSRLYAVTVDYFVTNSTGLVYPIDQFQANVNPVLEQVTQSPFYGLPSSLMSRDRTVVDKLSKIHDHLLDVKIIINLVGSGKRAPGDTNFAQEQTEKLTEMITLIDEIINELERKLP